MTLVKVYEKPIVTIFKSTIFSKASVYRLFVLAVLVVMPLIIAYLSQGFWIVTNSYMEQPDVNFKKEVLLIANTMAGNYLAWSTFSNYNLLLGDNFRSSSVSSYQVDANGDGLNDQLNITLQLPLDNSEEIVGFQLLLFFDYQLTRYSSFKMQSMVHLQQFSPVPAGSYTAFAALKLKQTTPLYHRGSDTRYDQSLVDPASVSVSDYDVSSILARNSQRNVTTALDRFQSTWQISRAAGAPFEVKVVLDYEVETVVYFSGFWELVKWGWVQYLAVLLLLKFFVNQLDEAVFGTQLLTTVRFRPKVKYN